MIRRVMGVDPGTIACGWAMLERDPIPESFGGSLELELVASGVIHPSKRVPRTCTIEGCGHPIPISRCSGCGAKYPLADKAKIGRGARVGIIAAELGKLIEVYRPEILMLETAWAGTHASAVIGVSETRGAALAAATSAKAPPQVIDVQPTVHKKTTTGRGNASKQEVQDAILVRFKSQLTHPMTFDESDACSIALHAFTLEN